MSVLEEPPRKARTFRVALVNAHIEHPLSGEAQSFLALAEALEKSGVDVDAVGSELIDEENSKREKFFKKVVSSLLLPRYVQRVAKQADLVHLFLPAPGMALLGDVVCAVLKKPVVVSYSSQYVNLFRQNFFACCYADPAFAIPRLGLNGFLASALSFKRARTYIVASHFQARQLREAGYGKTIVEVVPNLPNANFSTYASRDLAIVKPKRIVYIGHLFPIKGVAVLLDALKIYSGWREAVIAVSGLGDVRALERRVRNHPRAGDIQIVGKVDVGALLSEGGVLVAPYLSSFGTALFPSVLLEAMAVGIPIVTSNLAPIVELFEGNDGAALFAEAGNARSLAAAITKCVEDVEFSQTMIAKQRKIFLDRFDPESIVIKHVSIYNRALGRE